MHGLLAGEFVGLVGLTLALASGKVLDPLRNYLKRFTHPWNPGPWLAELLSCSMCTGFWVGFFYGLAQGDHVLGCVLLGGIVSLLSMLGYIGFQLLEAIAARILPTTYAPGNIPASHVMQQLQESRARKEERAAKSKLAQGLPLTETEAEFLADVSEQSADRNR